MSESTQHPKRIIRGGGSTDTMSKIIWTQYKYTIYQNCMNKKYIYKNLYNILNITWHKKTQIRHDTQIIKSKYCKNNPYQALILIFYCQLKIGLLLKSNAGTTNSFFTIICFLLGNPMPWINILSLLNFTWAYVFF